MKRGEIWTAAGGSDYAGKPRPAVIVQSDFLGATNSLTVCLFSTTNTESSLFQLVVEPNHTNGLMFRSKIMVDKITTVQRSKVGKFIGRLDETEMLLLNRALRVFLVLP